MSAGPVHYWPLDETGGDTVEDVNGGLEGSVVGDPSDITSIPAGSGFGRARNLELGNPAHLFLHQAPDNPAVVWDEWSVMIRFRRAAGDVSPWLYGQRTSEDTNSLEMAIVSGIEIYTWMWGPAGDPHVLFSDLGRNVFDGAWHRMTLTCDGATLRQYVDADEVGSESGDFQLMPESEQVIGWAYYWGNGGQIAVDDIGLFDYALTPEQVALWHAVPLSEVVEFEDWRVDADPLTTTPYYVLDVDDGDLPPLRVPISSWQATLQQDRSSYAQVVIPAAQPWVSGLAARAETGEFIISGGLRYADGSTREHVIVRAPLRNLRIDEGPRRLTATVSAHWTLPENLDPRTREMRGIRSQTNTPGIRLRADLDWFARPGDVVEGRGHSFTAAYLNMYVTGSEQYMDVGERLE
jgi:hypothetical protein